jgi:two-component system, chemotaxis family, CheB/CheR fusion protein
MSAIANLDFTVLPYRHQSAELRINGQGGVQNDPGHESALTQILGRATSMPVCEAADNLPVKDNHIYVIPPNRVLSIVEGVLKLRPRFRLPAPQRTIDLFFESLARDQHECAIGVILSGTASDGTLGLCAIKEEGGITFAQDQSAACDSMPRNAIAAGCVDFVLPASSIALNWHR